MVKGSGGTNLDPSPGFNAGTGWDWWVPFPKKLPFFFFFLSLLES